MTTITINEYEGLDYLYVDDEWKGYVCENFDEKVVLLGNRNYREESDASWWNDAKDITQDLDVYYDDDIEPFVDWYKHKYTREQIENIIKAYDNCEYSDDPELLMKVAMIINPELKLEMETIRGSVQGEWRDVVYVDGVDIDKLSDFHFGEISSIHIETEDNSYEDWDIITNTELWRMRDLKKELRERYKLPKDEKIVIKKLESYKQILVPIYETIE